MLSHCVCMQNYVSAFNYIVCTHNIWCVYKIVLYACKTILFYEHTKCAYARKWFSTRKQLLYIKYTHIKGFVLVTRTMYANKIGLYMYTSCEGNSGFAQQKSTTDPVKCSANMNNLCFKVFRRDAFMCLSKFYSFLFLHQINVSCVCICGCKHIL